MYTVSSTIEFWSKGKKVVYHSGDRVLPEHESYVKSMFSGLVVHRSNLDTKQVNQPRNPIIDHKPVSMLELHKSLVEANQRLLELSSKIDSINNKEVPEVSPLEDSYVIPEISGDDVEVLGSEIDKTVNQSDIKSRIKKLKKVKDQVVSDG